MNVDPVATRSGVNSSLPRTAMDLISIFVVWALAVAIANPIGEFPLNDDWSYSLTAKGLAEGKGYHPTEWTEMNLFTHALWGALFCLPAGFSFTALRISTLAMSLMGALAMYGLIRQLPKPRHLALICALVLAFNPIYFALSHTFMADVPFTTWAIFSAWFFVRHLQKDLKSDLLIATAFALVATLARQIGLFLPAAFGLTLLIKHGWDRHRLIRISLPLLICLLAHISFRYWLKVAEKVPSDTNMLDRLCAALTNPVRIPVNITYYSWNMLMYLGWFLLPLILLGTRSRGENLELRPWFKKVPVGVWIFIAVSIVRFVLRPGLMPVHNNILSPQGIGPATLRDTFILKLEHQQAIPTFFWLIVTSASMAGAVLLILNLSQGIRRMISEIRSNRANPSGLISFFFLVGIMAYLSPFLVAGFFDRYLVLVTAFLLPFLAAGSDPANVSRARRSGVVILIAATGIFGVAATRDYLEWNRIRWIAAREFVTESGLTLEELDGGFEINSWHTHAQSNQPERRGNRPAYLAWASKVPYVITFDVIDGFEPVRRYSYRNWLPPYEGEILLLKRKVED